MLNTVFELPCKNILLSDHDPALKSVVTLYENWTESSKDYAQQVQHNSTHSYTMLDHQKLIQRGVVRESFYSALVCAISALVVGHASDELRQMLADNPQINLLKFIPVSLTQLENTVTLRVRPETITHYVPHEYIFTGKL